MARRLVSGVSAGEAYAEGSGDNPGGENLMLREKKRRREKEREGDIYIYIYIYTERDRLERHGDFVMSC